MNIAFKPDIVEPASPKINNFLHCWSEGYRQVAISGPRNCAKSLQILGYWLTLHELIPNLRSLIVRSEAKTIPTTIIRTLEDKLLRYPFESGRNPFTLYGGPHMPRELIFSNGGKCDFGGMDNSAKFLGGSYDFIFFNQVEREWNEQHWSDLLGTMAGARNAEWFVDGKPFYQIVADANPNDPSHWLYQRKDNKELAWYDFTHKDHPLLYDWDKEEYTERGLETIRDLEEAYPPGHTRDRMVYGKWVGSTGRVYPMFDPKKHERPVKRSEIPPHAQWYMSVDWGGSDPHAVGFYAVWDEMICLYKEIYKSGIMVSEVLKTCHEILDRHEIPRVGIMFTDHNTDHRLQAEEAGFPVQLADKKDMLTGIELCKNMIADGRLLINSNSLVEEDPELEGKPKRLADELVSYRYPENVPASRSKFPVDKDNHACDHFRYLCKGVETVDTYYPIDETMTINQEWAA